MNTQLNYIIQNKGFTMNIKIKIYRALSLLLITITFSACGAYVSDYDLYEDYPINTTSNYIYPNSIDNKSVYYIYSSGENIVFAGDTSVVFEIYDSNNIYLSTRTSGVSYVSPGYYSIKVISLYNSYDSAQVMIYQQNTNYTVPYLDNNTYYNIQNRTSHLYKIDLEYLNTLYISNNNCEIEIYDEYLNEIYYEDNEYLSNGTYYVLINSNDLYDSGYYSFNLSY